MITYNRCRNDIVSKISVSRQLLSSAVKSGTHFLENNKIIEVFTMLKLCVSKEHQRSNVTCNSERDTM